MIKVIFVDIDNTLLSFSGYVREAMREGFKKYGLKPYEDNMYPVFERINNGFWRQIEQGSLTMEALQKTRWNTIFHELGIDFDGSTFETYFRDRLFDSAVLIPHAKELLEYLSGKYVLCAASNGPYEQQVNRLRVGNLYEYFTHFFISEKIGAQKPCRVFFERCFDILKVAPEEAAIIGDSVTADIAGGKEYGMTTILYRPESHPTDAVPEADHIVSKLAEIEVIF